MKRPLMENLLRWQFFVLGMLMIFQCLGRPDLASGCFTATFLLTLGIWLACAVSGLHRLNILAMLLVLGALGAVAVNALLTETVVTPSYWKKGIMFSATVLLFGSLWCYVPEKGLVRFLFRWSSGMTLFFLGMYLLDKPRMFQLQGRQSGYLTFCFTSPNLTAVFLSALCMVEMIRLTAARERKGRFFHLVLTAVLVWFVWQTRARNALLMLGCFFLLAVFLRNRSTIPKTLAALLAGSPMVFAITYLLVIDWPWVKQLFSFLTGEGKGLDSRNLIWRFAWDAFCASPLVGAYSQISGESGMSQMHNSHVDVLASYGLPVFSLFCVFLYRLLARAPGKSGKGQCLCRLAFGALLLSGLGEAMLFSGGMGIYLLPGMLLMLANFDFERYEDSVFQ